MKLNRILEVAYREAEKSTHNYRLGAVIFRQGKVLSKGYNKTNRGSNTNYGHWEGSLHAELAAIINAKTSLKKAAILVARRNGGLSRPCGHCMAAIKEAGIKRVFYTDITAVVEEAV